MNKLSISTRDEFESILKAINDSKFLSVHHADDSGILSTDPVETEMDVDKHRWYEISTNVYEVYDWFLGVRGPSQLYSENSDWEDHGCDVEAFEMEAVPTVTYRRKEGK